jgi:DNA helicase HerA-like ATPase
MVTASPTINLKPEDRAAFFGRTGSGKTTLAKALLLGYKRFVVIDAKHTVNMGPAIPIRRDFDKKLDRQIIRVPMYDKKRDKRRTAELERWEDVIDAVWRAGNRIMYVDELTLITRPRPLLPSLAKAIRTGRERGLGVWSGSQRPKEIPSEVFTESEHFFIFQLGYALDRLKVVKFTRDELWKTTASIEGHRFTYFGVRENITQRFKPIALRGNPAS